MPWTTNVEPDPPRKAPRARSRKVRNALLEPRIPEPNAVVGFIPGVGAAWQAAADLERHRYGSAALNAAFAIGELTPLAPAARGLRYARAGLGVLKRGSVTANAAAKMIKSRGLAKAGTEIHHSIPLKGKSRTVQDWRNHYAFLKVLPKEQHRRLTGRWDGKPMYDPVRKLWYGTTDWQKATPTGVAIYGGDVVENVSRRPQMARGGRE